MTATAEIIIKQCASEGIFYAKGEHTFKDFWEALPTFKGHPKPLTYNKDTFKVGWLRLVNGILYHTEPGKGAFIGTSILDWERS